MNGRQVCHLPVNEVSVTDMLTSRFTDQTRCRERPKYRAGKESTARYEAHRIRARGRRSVE